MEKLSSKSHRNLIHESGTGFTLIETLIYMALFAIIIGGGMVAVYQLIQGADASYNHVILQEEANFLLRKIDWALTGATSADIVSSNLVTQKPILGSNVQLTFSLSGNNLTLQRGSAGANVLNSSSIVVSGVSFTKNAQGGFKTDFTLTTFSNGKPASQSFSTTKYLR